jgi:hypothetical protein
LPNYDACIVKYLALVSIPSFRLPCLDMILGDSGQNMCILCGEVVRERSIEQLIKCQKPNCSGQYCTSCYRDLNNMCTICMQPTEYGDLSDESIEK